MFPSAPHCLTVSVVILSILVGLDLWPLDCRVSLAAMDKMRVSECSCCVGIFAGDNAVHERATHFPDGRVRPEMVGGDACGFCAAAADVGEWAGDLGAGDLDGWGSRWLESKF